MAGLEGRPGPGDGAAEVRVVSALHAVSAASLTALMIAVKLQYTHHAGIHLTGLPEALWE